MSLVECLLPRLPTEQARLNFLQSVPTSPPVLRRRPRRNSLIRIQTHWARRFSKKILRKTIASARDALELEVHRQGRELRNFATTLIMAICTHDLTGTAQIGDGAVVTARRGDGDGEFVYALFSPPQRGEYANQTNFITSDSWQDALDVRTLPEGLGYMMMFTDGIQSLALDSAASYAPHGPFFDPLLRWIGLQGDLKGADETLKTFLSSPRVAERTDDDLTLVLAVRHKDKRPREDEIE